MLDLRFAGAVPRSATVVAMVARANGAGDGDAGPADDPDDTGSSDESATTLLGDPPPGVDPDEVDAVLREVKHKGKAGSVQTWVRPMRPVARLWLVGVGDRDEGDWRAAGAALARKAKREERLTLVLPAGLAPAELRGLAEGLWLASYSYRLTSGEEGGSALRRVTLVSPDGAAATDVPETAAAVEHARVAARMTMLARDLTNTPSDQKTPAWLARRLVREGRGTAGLTVTVREPEQLAAEGFGGVLAVGSGSANGPRVVEMAWRPRGARRHVVLVGKGITFDTGGICIKSRDGMKLMRKDMGGAAAVAAATLGAAALGLPLRVTAVLPIAENMPGGEAMRPGDVVRHYGGMTTEVRNTDAEGRLVLADALQYAARRLRPDLLVDLATLTGAQSVALGKRTAALFSDDDNLAAELTDAGAGAGELMWRLPLHDDYVDALSGDDTDMVNSTDIGGGSMMAALFLREFTGDRRDRWAHIDMSAPAWSDSADGALTKGATGWGVRTLLRWLAALAPVPARAATALGRGAASDAPSQSGRRAPSNRALKPHE
jgi:leucyl aminopeptidase